MGVRMLTLQNNLTSQVRRSEKFLRNFGKQVRRSAQFLRSFGKQWEAELPTFLLKINELDKNTKRRKNWRSGKL